MLSTATAEDEEAEEADVEAPHVEDEEPSGASARYGDGK